VRACRSAETIHRYVASPSRLREIELGKRSVALLSTAPTVGMTSFGRTMRRGLDIGSCRPAMHPDLKLEFVAQRSHVAAHAG